MNINKIQLPSAAVDRAIAIIQEQELTPESPAYRTSDGNVTLCAAAALAAAGFDIAGRVEEREQFEREICESRSSEGIRTVFLKLGWPIDLCDRTILENDSLPPAVRTQGVVRYLSSISADSAA